MDSILRDLRHSLRMLAKRPGFSVAVIITLALGIGANTAIFTVVDAALLRSLPYKNGDRLVHVWETCPAKLNRSAKHPTRILSIGRRTTGPLNRWAAMAR